MSTRCAKRPCRRWSVINKVFLFGLDVDDHKGIQGSTLGLQDRFGPERVFGTPLSEDAMTGSRLARRWLACAHSRSYSDGLCSTLHEPAGQYGGEGSLHVRRASESANRDPLHDRQIMGARCPTQSGLAIHVHACTWTKGRNAIERARCEGVHDCGNTRRQSSDIHRASIAVLDRMLRPGSAVTPSS